MDYGELITSAWRISWRNRGLWLVGLFAGTPSSSCSSSFGSSGDVDSLTEAFPNGAGFDLTDLEIAIEALQEAVPLLIVIGAIVLVLAIGFWLLSVACTAAVIAGGREEAAGRPITVGAAWSRGLQSFGRLLRLELLWIVFWLLVVAVIVLVAIASITGQPRGQVDWLRLLFSLIGVIALVGIAGSLLGIVLAYAQRAVVLDAQGVLASLQTGFGLMRAKFGTSLLVWLIGVALAIGGGVALLIALLVLVLPTLLLGAIIGFLISLAGVPWFVGIAVLLAIVVPVALIVGGAALNTYVWHYWTLAYLRLSGGTTSTQPPLADAV